ncbi:hypothetical protein J2X84_002426 [Pseudomonas corrugata]|jgi:hypothetical protein|uniref:hypothetical protein n=1 Tax=Pseudomonas corrugata TaxID=47879 RepID=UPI002856AB95|nr:hypothetical protein [Pseudomonas corrugata]MDR7283597.1 hypothetical protein [Pseudomonas corrugata]
MFQGMEHADGMIGGHGYFDAAFNLELMPRLLGPSSEKASSMHIATHFNVEKSLRLVKLTTKQILGWTPRLGHYYLIVLSA